MSLYSMLKPNGPNGFGYGTTAEEVTQGISLEGKTILLTGCNSGLGFETMKVLASRGAHVIGTARTEHKAQEACSLIQGTTTGIACELSQPASVRACVEGIKKKGIRLDVIICNAGIMALPKLEKAFGYELQFFTNHIGHFILVTGLLDSLADDGRVVMLSSSAHNMAPPEGIQFDNLSGDIGYRAWTAYGQSKLANLLFAKELSRKFSGTKKTANAVHPGVIQTNLGRHMTYPLVDFVFTVAKSLVLKNIPQGAATTCYVATQPSNVTHSGQYFADCNPKACRKDADNEALASRLWTTSEKIISELK